MAFAVNGRDDKAHAVPEGVFDDLNITGNTSRRDSLSEGDAARDGIAPAHGPRSKGGRPPKAGGDAPAIKITGATARPKL